MKEVAQEQFYRDYKDQAGIKYPTKSLVNQDGKKFMETRSPNTGLKTRRRGLQALSKPGRNLIRQRRPFASAT